MTSSITDLTPFQMPEAANLDTPTDTSLIWGANAVTDEAPGFWSFLSIYNYLKTKLGLGDVLGLDDALAAKQSVSAKGEANGYASLDAASKVPATQLPAAISLNSVTLTTFANATPADGDLWFDGTNLKFQVGGATKTVTLA